MQERRSAQRYLPRESHNQLCAPTAMGRPRSTQPRRAETSRGRPNSAEVHPQETLGSRRVARGSDDLGLSWRRQPRGELKLRFANTPRRFTKGNNQPAFLEIPATRYQKRI